MISDAVNVPPLLMRERSVEWSIGASTVSPGQTGIGTFPLARMDGGGCWQARWTNIDLRTADQVRCFRAIAAAAESGVVPLIVPQCDKRHFPVPIVGGSPLYSYGPIPHSDGSFFSDGSGYTQPVVVAVSVGNAALRATTITISFIQGAALRGGEIFSINHPVNGWRRYEIKTVEIDGPGNSVVTFRPPLRSDVPTGTDIEFDLPRCVMRLASPDAMNIDLDLRKFGQPSVMFVEYPWDNDE